MSSGRQEDAATPVIMILIILREAGTKVMDGYGDFSAADFDVPWNAKCEMHNRIAHGYFEINLDVV